MKKIEKPDWWKEVPMMSGQDLIDYGQKLYDKMNFSGLSLEEHNRLTIVKNQYKEQTGKELPLAYNCPP